MDEEEHSPSKFYYPDEETDPSASFRYDNEESETTRTPNSKEQIDQFLINLKAKNTMKKTRSDLNILHRYVETINEGDIEISGLPLQALDRLLCKLIFFMNVKKQGTDYEPSTLSSCQRSMQRYLDEKKYSGNILKAKNLTRREWFSLVHERR